MAKAIVTIICIAGVGLGIVLLVLLRSARTETPLLPAGSSLGTRAQEGIRLASASLAGGILGGVLTAGLGGRLLMRIIAVTSDQQAQGRLTEADEVVGRVSVDGTIFLVLFVGVFAGAVGATGFALARSVLPRGGAAAGLVVAGIVGGLLVLPSDLLNPESVDFRILGPTWLAALMIVVLVAVFGATSGVLIDTFTSRWPAPSVRGRGLVGLLPIVVLILPSPLFLAVLVVVVVRGWERPGLVHGRIGRSIAALLAVAGLAGWVWILTAAVEIAF